METAKAATGGRLAELTGPVHRLMAKPVVFTDADTTLRNLAAAMTDEAVGALVVRGADGSTTIVTERDIVEALADGADPDDTWAGEVSSLDLTAAGPEDRLSDVVHLMAERNIRHVPVMAYDSVVGMVSARDVLRIVDAAH